MAVEIAEHIDLDNAVAEMHDELYRMVDFDELDAITDAITSYDKLREYMDGFRNYLTQRQATIESETDGSVRTSSSDQNSGTVPAAGDLGGLPPTPGPRYRSQRTKPSSVSPRVREKGTSGNSDT